MKDTSDVLWIILQIFCQIHQYILHSPDFHTCICVLLFWKMVSFSFKVTRRSIRISPPLKCICIPCFLQMCYSSHSALLCKASIYSFLFVVLGCLRSQVLLEEIVALLGLLHGSIELMCSRNLCLSDSSCTTNESSTYLSHILGECFAEFMALISKSLMLRLATIGQIGYPVAPPSSYSKTLPWKRKSVFIRQNSSVQMICSTEIDVLWWNYQSCSSFLLMIMMAGSIGKDIKSAVSSWEVISRGPGKQSPLYSLYGRWFPTHGTWCKNIQLSLYRYKEQHFSQI